MKTGIRAVAAVLLVVLPYVVAPGVMHGQPQDVPVLTVCDVMKGLVAYKGKTVSVVGRSKGTMEGSWLDQTCPTKLISDGYEWSTSISLSYVATDAAPAPALPRAFHWSKVDLGQRLAEVQKTTVLEALSKYHYTDMWIAVYGRLETPFRSMVC